MNIEIRDDKVIIPKEQFNEESEINYLNFVLGYDLLNSMFKNSKYPECDLSYDFCDYLSRKFIKSDEYENTKFSTYEMLTKWLDTNKKQIEKEYQEDLEKREEIKENKQDIKWGVEEVYDEYKIKLKEVENIRELGENLYAIDTILETKEVGSLEIEEEEITFIIYNNKVIYDGLTLIY